MRDKSKKSDAEVQSDLPTADSNHANYKQTTSRVEYCTTAIVAGEDIKRE